MYIYIYIYICIYIYIYTYTHIYTYFFDIYRKLSFLMTMITNLWNFCGMLDQRKMLSLISRRAIVRDSHHYKSSTRSKISVVRLRVKESTVFILLVLRLILIHIFSPRKDNALFSLLYLFFVAICDLVLYLLHDHFNISIAYNGTIPFQYLKAVVVMEDSTFSETGNQFIFPR